ncbi:MAG: LytR C-terminal domain-containing protein [Actinomycetota bacterium]|nr:LytR C-terminal domain-containing protein [Actinomycetota bacterium]
MGRRLITAATMLGLLALLVAGAYFGWVGLTRGWDFGDGSATADDEATSSCTTPPPVTVRARRVRVSVYNAGAPGGQATATMDALTDQGFREGELTDAPEPIDVNGFVVVAGRTTDPAAVELVQRQLPQARVAERRKPLGPGVNVLVGRQFTGLTRNAPTSIKVPQPEVCEGSPSPGGTAALTEPVREPPRPADGA